MATAMATTTTATTPTGGSGDSFDESTSVVAATSCPASSVVSANGANVPVTVPATPTVATVLGGLVAAVALDGAIVEPKVCAAVVLGVGAGVGTVVDRSREGAVEGNGVAGLAVGAGVGVAVDGRDEGIGEGDTVAGLAVGAPIVGTIEGDTDGVRVGRAVATHAIAVARTIPGKHRQLYPVPRPASSAQYVVEVSHPWPTAQT